jgi:thiamine pyridinylase
MDRIRTKILVSLIGGLIVLAAAGILRPWTTFAEQNPQNQTIKALRVALFPYVPAPQQMQDLISRHWKERHPDVPVEFVNWDGYKKDPDPDLDVFEYDAIFLDHVVRNNFASPLNLSEIENVQDLLAFALSGSMVDGIPYGIPRLACSPVLFYRKGDREIEAAQSLRNLFEVIGESDGNQPEPPKGKGLLLDLTGGTTCACLYLDAVSDLIKNYSVVPELPAADQLNEEAVSNLNLLTRMAGKAQVLFENYDGQRARWFADGSGRAFVGFTESLYHIPKSVHEDVRIRSLPLAQDNSVNLFFVDILSISAAISGRRRELALEFANLCASYEVMLGCLLLEDLGRSPQYLLPVRKSLLYDQRLVEAAHLYKDLQPILEDSPKTFRIGIASRDWLRKTKGTIQGRITGQR